MNQMIGLHFSSFSENILFALAQNLWRERPLNVMMKFTIDRIISADLIIEKFCSLKNFIHFLDAFLFVC